MKKALSIACAIAAPMLFNQSALAEFDYFQEYDSFKRFSVSAGWLHAAPQGNPTPVQNTTVIQDGTIARNGDVQADTVLGVLDLTDPRALALEDTLKGLGTANLVESLGDSGSTEIYGLENFATVGTGLQADRSDTIGLLLNYHITDNWSFETKAGIPPTVDILGKGTVIAPFNGTALTDFVGDFDIADNIEITDMSQGDVASSARAWLPAAEVHYQIGTSGVNKLRPYVGVGFIYAYFNDIELNSGIRDDLEIAGHRIQNIRTQNAGASLLDKDDPNVMSNSAMHVDVEASDDFAPMFTIGTTYDFDENWFAVGSITYAELDSDTTITVENDAGEQLIKAVSNIDIDPYISYVGVGYRF